MSNYSSDVESLSTVTSAELTTIPGADARVTHLENVILQHAETIEDLVDTVDGITESGTIGSATVGDTATPVYLSGGTVTACSSTVGAKAQPVFLYKGTVTACSSTVGDSDTPVYLKSGVVTACSTSLSEVLESATSGTFPTIEKVSSVTSNYYVYAPTDGSKWWCFGFYYHDTSYGDSSSGETLWVNKSVSAGGKIVSISSGSISTVNIMCIRIA